MLLKEWYLHFYVRRTILVLFISIVNGNLFIYNELIYFL